MCSSINAKRDEKTGVYTTLLEHTRSVLKNLKKIIDTTGILDVYSRELNVPTERLKYLAFNCAFFHDLGKATSEFQEKLEKNSKRTDVPHALHSASMVHKISDFFEYGTNIVAFAIMTHHSKVDSQLYSDKRFVNNPTYLKIEINEYMASNYIKCAREFGITTLTATPNNFSFDVNDSIRSSIMDYSEAATFSRPEFNLLYTLLNGLLKLSDWLASADKTFEEQPRENIDQLLICDLKEKHKKFDGWREFQQKAKERQGHVILKAATGSGKTEAALLWAQNNIDPGSRIIYALPTQTTINKMYERIKPIFRNSIGIVHSAAKDYLEETEDGDVDEYTLVKTFVKPITITTLDSFLLSFFPIGPYTQRQINLFNSVIILDELHAYDQQIIGILLGLLQDKSFMNFKICIMSATLPLALIQRFEEILGKDRVKIITDKESYNRKLYGVEVRTERILDDTILAEITLAYHAGKKVIVRTNTIRKSIDVYRKLIKQGMKRDVLLFNSNFIVKDRIKKEDTICNVSDENKPFVVVCTSIIQMSLDIDYDVLFTELCPIDDIIQAGGRINRKNIREDAKLIVCSNGGNYHPYPNQLIVDETAKCIKQYGGHLLSLEQMDALVDKVYPKIDDCELSEGKRIYSGYASKIEKLYTGDDKLKLRKESYVGLDVVPQQLLSKEEKLSKIILCVPVYIVQKFPSFFPEKMNNGILVTNIEYSSEDGLHYLDSALLKNDVEKFDNIV